MAPSTSTSSLPAELVNDWLKLGAVIGALALLLAAFHGIRSDFKADIQASEARLRADISELRADNRELKADYRALNQKLDRVLESLLQP